VESGRDTPDNPDIRTIDGQETPMTTRNDELSIEDLDGAVGGCGDKHQKKEPEHTLKFVKDEDGKLAFLIIDGTKFKVEAVKSPAHAHKASSCG
jgi:hypothetical protein